MTVPSRVRIPQPLTQQREEFKMTETKPSEVLQSIADVLLGLPEVWVQGNLATNAVGSPVANDSPSACRWCARGLIIAADPHGMCQRDAQIFVCNVINGQSLISWNDDHERTVAHVQAAFQKAADLARKEGQ